MKKLLLVLLVVATMLMIATPALAKGNGNVDPGQPGWARPNPGAGVGMRLAPPGWSIVNPGQGGSR